MYADLTNAGTSIITGKENVVIRSCLETIKGGKTLDVTGFGPAVINAGHVIIRETTGSKNYKPMPLATNDTVYAALPANHEYAGILRANILKERPFAAIMVRGSFNPAASPFDVSTISAAVKTALPLITHYTD